MEGVILYRVVIILVFLRRGYMRKDLKELKIEDLNFRVKGKSKCKSFEMRKVGIFVVLEYSEWEVW